MKPPFSYAFLDAQGTFEVKEPANDLYFPLANETGLLSYLTPSLQGTLTLDQHSFLAPPLVREDLTHSRSSFNFWLSFKSGHPWSVSGPSTTVQAGLLWHQTTRVDKKLGLSALTLSYVPAEDATFQVMIVQITNTSKKKMSFTATSAIPLYGRSADNVRDHRHVTSLLNRVTLEKHGITLKPTMSFNERGHSMNQTSYYVVGMDEAGQAPAGVFPTIESFIGDGGTLEKPQTLIENKKPFTKLEPLHQGREALGALQFRPATLGPGKSTVFLLLMGIDPEGKLDHTPLIKKYGHQDVMCKLGEENRAHWTNLAERIGVQTGDQKFNRWMMWVKTQPTLRKLFGNSFLPDFDYGRGGRGWRDLWQDCLALLLSSPSEVRQDMLRNFGGVRPNGSNATIIVRKKSGVEFVADRNNISRIWMDHGLWPFFTTQLYLHQTGDWAFLQEKAPYFMEKKTGSVLEHLLLQTVAPFFDVGEHNNLKLLDADWNDGLDMAPDRGESVAFTAFFAGNLNGLADILQLAKEKTGLREVKVAKEMALLFDTLEGKVNYDSVGDKQKRRDEFRAAVENGFTGEQITLPIEKVVADLWAKAAWIKSHLNKNEWLEESGNGWFNGYYDNKGRRVEGKHPNGLRMTLTGQVFPIMAEIADAERTGAIVKSVQTHLFDKKLGGIRLNTDFGGPQPDLGRAFSFSYGDKENGAVFSHMVVMYANALYRRGFVNEGHAALSSLYKMATDTAKSRMYPGLPEYFDGSGRGLYCFLTGSASWYVYTLLCQVFGVRGEGGDLLISPKLVPDQFAKNRQAGVELFFAGARLRVRFHNIGKRSYDNWQIKSVTSGKEEIPLVRQNEKEVLIARNTIAQKKVWEIEVHLQ